MRSARVQGLTPDGRTLLLRLEGPDGGEVIELSLADVRQAQRVTPPLPLGGAPSPREIQSRIRGGESADDIARACGLPVSEIAKFEGPVIAEREYHGRQARLSDADGRSVQERVEEYAERLGTGPVVWDCFQTDPQRWEVTAEAGELTMRLAWDPGTRRTDPLDEASKQALGRAPLPEEALEAVLRQVRSPQPREEPPAPVPAAVPLRTPAPPRPEAPPPPAAGPRKRKQVPLWDDISSDVAGRDNK